MQVLGLRYTTVHSILKRLEENGLLEAKRRKATGGPRYRYKITEKGIVKATEVGAKDSMESKHNKALREALKAHIERMQRDRSLSKAQIANLITDKLPEGETFTHPYLADLMSGRRNLLTGRCIALLNALNVELEVKVIRKRARA